MMPKRLLDEHGLNQVKRTRSSKSKIRLSKFS